MALHTAVARSEVMFVDVISINSNKVVFSADNEF